MNILELTGMNSTKYGGLENYFVTLMRHCPNDKFYFVYETAPQCADYVNDVQNGGVRFASNQAAPSITCVL